MRNLIGAVLFFIPWLAVAGIQTPPEYERDYLPPLYDGLMVDSRLPSEVERDRADRRLIPMVCIITQAQPFKGQPFKGQVQHCGLFIGGNFAIEDPIRICRSYAMEQGRYLSDTLEIPRSSVVTSWELGRVE